MEKKKKKITINGKEYVVEIDSFDDRSEKDESGMYEYIYKGVKAKVAVEGKEINMKKYDDEPFVCVGVKKDELSEDLLELLLKITQEAFGTTRIRVLTDKGYQTP